MNRLLTASLFSVFWMMSIGCAPITTRTYSGPALPADKIARLWELNGPPIMQMDHAHNIGPANFWRVVELLPGQHTLQGFASERVSDQHVKMSETRSPMFRWQAKAGEDYAPIWGNLHDGSLLKGVRRLDLTGLKDPNGKIKDRLKFVRKWFSENSRSPNIAETVP